MEMSEKKRGRPRKSQTKEQNHYFCEENPNKSDFYSKDILIIKENMASLLEKIKKQQKESEDKLKHLEMYRLANSKEVLKLVSQRTVIISLIEDLGKKINDECGKLQNTSNSIRENLKLKEGKGGFLAQFEEKRPLITKNRYLLLILTKLKKRLKYRRRQAIGK